jgi:hypothetical protein
MTNHPNRSRKASRLPEGVYYTSRNGGMYVSWNGRPEGSVMVTIDRDTAYGEDGEFGWQSTPFQGADGRCRRAEVIRLAAEYFR